MNALKECTTVKVPVYSVRSLSSDVFFAFPPLILHLYVRFFDILRANEGFSE